MVVGGGKAGTKLQINAFADNKRHLFREVMVRLGNSGTGLELSGMVHKIDKRKNEMETYPDTGWPGRRLIYLKEIGL